MASTEEPVDVIYVEIAEIDGITILQIKPVPPQEASSIKSSSIKSRSKFASM